MAFKKTTRGRMSTASRRRDPITGARPMIGEEWPHISAFPVNHPINNKKANEKLVKHIKDRLDFANENRSNFIAMLQSIDTEISGFIVLDRKDQIRERENRLGRGPKPTKSNLELVKTQLDEAVTYLLNVFAPDSSIYQATAAPSKQFVAKAFANKLNMDAEKKQYYRHYAKGLLDMLKYNVGGWIAYWDQQHGTKLMPTPDKTSMDIKENQVVWEGNCVKAFDPYNLLWDASVSLPDVAEQGEFFAVIELHRQFRVKKMEADGDIYNTVRFINQNTSTDIKYYQAKPAMRLDINVESINGRTQTDWVTWFKGTSGSREVTSGVETVHYFGWIVPKEFNLSPSDNLEIWRITMMANGYIVAAQKLDNAHGMLPLAAATPNEDGMEGQTRSFAESLIPLQRFGSHLLNIHVEASRKALYGITFFDPSVIPFNQIPEGDVVARIPISPQGYGKGLKEFIYQVTDAPPTERTMDDLKSVMDIMQKILPTDILRQVASLERATMYQAAATVQSGNRRCQKLAKMIEDMAMKRLRFMLMYNVFQYMTMLQAVDDNGNDVQISPADFIEANIEFVISDGLKGIDKLQIIEGYKELISIIVQNREALQDFDIIAFLNYWSSLLGDKTDLSQFKIKTVLNQLSPEVQQVLSQLVQSGALNKQITDGVKQLQANNNAASQGQNIPLLPPGPAGQIPTPTGGEIPPV